MEGPSDHTGSTPMFAIFVLSLYSLYLIPYTIYKLCGGSSENVRGEATQALWDGRASVPAGGLVVFVGGVPASSPHRALAGEQAMAGQELQNVVHRAPDQEAFAQPPGYPVDHLHSLLLVRGGGGGIFLLWAYRGSGGFHVAIAWA